MVDRFTAEQRARKVYLGFPVGGSETHPFSDSLRRLVRHESMKPFAWLQAQMMAAARAGRALTPADVQRLLTKAQDQNLLLEIKGVQGLYVADNRTLLIQKFLKSTDADWLLQIDTDIEFPETIVETMLSLVAGSDRKILAASVPLGSAYPTCAFMRAETPGAWRSVPRINGLIECDGLATAVILIHRQVFEDIADRHGQCWMHHIYLPKISEAEFTTARAFEFISQGEDLAFSVRAADAGHKLYCAFVPGLKHHKTKALSHDAEYMAAADNMAQPGVGELVAEEATA